LPFLFCSFVIFREAPALTPLQQPANVNIFNNQNAATLQQSVPMEGGGFVSANIVGAATAAVAKQTPAPGRPRGMTRVHLVLRVSFPLLTASLHSAAMPPRAAPQPAHVVAVPVAEATPQDVYRKKQAAAAAKAGGDTGNSAQLQQSLQGRLFEVSSQELRLTDQIIGKGSFCSVVKGIFNGAVVAVKLPHNMQVTCDMPI
jgi:hypothetical protein